MTSASLSEASQRPWTEQREGQVGFVWGFFVLFLSVCPPWGRHLQRPMSPFHDNIMDWAWLHSFYRQGKLGQVHLNDVPNVTVLVAVHGVIFHTPNIKLFLGSPFFFFHLEKELNRPKSLEGPFESWETILWVLLRYQIYLSKINIVARHCSSHYSIIIFLLFIEFICDSRVMSGLTQKSIKGTLM